MGDSAPARATFPGAIRLFRFAGIDVFLHWMWVVVAIIEFRRQNVYRSQIWNVIEYLSLFGIVLMHEFGHALACRSVGGRADKILLWPLGGVAYVDPPKRPGAVLWSIAAGPLVNVLLVPVLLMGVQGDGTSDFHQFLFHVFVINLGLLIFNMLPIYPLDGGQIVQALLWFFVGQARSLAIAARIGLVGAGGVIVLAIWMGNPWLILLAVLGASQSWRGIKQAQMMSAVVETPRRTTARCPGCGESPPLGNLWLCNCGLPFDMFERDGQCPHCALVHVSAACPLCRASYPISWWKGEPLKARPYQPTGASI